jgi:hypothetical protein
MRFSCLRAGASTPAIWTLKSPYTLPTAADEGGRTATSSSTPSGTTSIERGSDLAAGGPAKQFLTAAKAAGVDVEDGDALKTFIEGWNARSEAP